ncbi:NEQ340 [Nanoarchaeum equitans Kin4-M]|uniref:NEQ340 n=1 Tax=Nanoarchaeum equitans (strain Kin4-M) TaxID=228908 RepID=Q74MB3_NANEQ|nr:NEQ340 [Nanoarchaeum equitans Kin4-M]
MGKKFLVFDYDGTLLNSIPILARYIYKKVSPFVKTDIREIEKLIGFPIHVIAYELAKDEDKAKTLIKLIDLKEAFEEYKKASLYWDAKIAIPQLHKNYRLAILTASPRYFVESTLGEYKKYFDIIDDRKEKSDLLDKIDAIAYVGDHIVDIEIGKKYNIPTYLIERPHNLHIKYKPKLKNLLQLVKILN